MFELKHYDENGNHFQDHTCNSVRDLNMYKEVQLSQGETLLIYCGIEGVLIEVVEK